MENCYATYFYFVFSALLRRPFLSLDAAIPRRKRRYRLDTDLETSNRGSSKIAQTDFACCRSTSLLRRLRRLVTS